MVHDDANQQETNELDSELHQRKLLVYIINQEIEFNEEPVTITFFKDITFGILYEQMMAQDDLQKIITNNLDQKIGSKLKKISDNVIKLSIDK